MIDKKRVERILIIKLKGIGDVVLSTIVLENLKKDFPNAKIDYLTEPASYHALKNISLINDILIYNKKKKFAGFEIIWRVFKKKYDLVLDLYSNPRTALITYLSFAVYRAGFPYRGRTYAYNLLGPAERSVFHAADLHLELLKSIGLLHTNKNLHFGISQKDIKYADDFISCTFKKNDFIVGISPSGGWESKKCDPIKFAEIADAFIDKYQVSILIVWGPEDKREADEIVSLMKHKAVLAPPTTITAMAGLMHKCKIIVANDSGPLHIASALRVPVLGLYGPTNPKLQGPYGNNHEFIRIEELDCINCNLLQCPKEHECFLNLSVDAIFKKFSLLIEKNKLTLN
jgi:lipopolysaccharide heptosyltransferase II